MTDVVRIRKLDEVYIVVDSDASICMELADYFTFQVPGYRFTPAYKNGGWDGKIRLYNAMQRTLYAGLRQTVETFCKKRGYEVEHLSDFSKVPFTLEDVHALIKRIGFPQAIKGDAFQTRDYQINTIQTAIQNERGLFLSPTSSGKSMMIYSLIRHYDCKTLLIVPTLTLIHQMFTDFQDYGFDSEANCHKVFSGQERITGKNIVISTWQTAAKMDKKWLAQFDMIIGDEAHTFAAKSLTGIMTKMTSCRYRFGLTGSLDDSKTNQLVLQGLFGPIHQVTTNAKMIEEGYSAALDINCLVLKYPDEIRKLIKGKTYQEEMDFIVSYEKRNKFLAKLAGSLKGNTLLLFNYVDRHGKLIYDLLKPLKDTRKVYFIHGGVDGEERNAVRAVVEKEQDAIIVASYGTFSTGINIKNLHNIIFASPTKSRIRNLQSIGRGLRKTAAKFGCTLYDVADDLGWKKAQNHTLKHFVARVKIYNEEKFPYKMYPITIN